VACRQGEIMRHMISRLFQANEQSDEKNHHPYHVRQCRKLAALLGLAGCLSLPANAADVVDVADASGQAGLHALITFGLTMGGEVIIPMQFTTGEEMHVRSGNFYQVGLGAQWQMESVPIALVATANYHVDQVPAENGFGEFERYPFEAIVYYVGSNWRLGVGGRRVLLPAARARKDDGSFDLKIEFQDANGAIAEIGYAASEHVWLNFRVVREEYRGQTVTFQGNKIDARSLTIDGSHVGINFVYVF
jgi:hypothetical protein